MGAAMSKVPQVSVQWVSSKGVPRKKKKAKVGGNGEDREEIERIQDWKERVEGMVNANEEAEKNQRSGDRVISKEEECGYGDRYAMSDDRWAFHPFSEDVYWCSKSSPGNIDL